MPIKTVFLFGTSSAGKTSLTNEFPHEYDRIRVDDYYDKYYHECRAHVLKKIKNKYIGTNTIEQEIWKEFDNLFVKSIKNAKKSVVDDVALTSLAAVPNRKERRVFLIYAPIKDMIRNIKSRRTTDTRDLRAFEHMPNFYIATCDSKKAIDKISRPLLLKEFQAIKWLFESPSHMQNFVIDLCKNMGIVTDEPHMIRAKHDIYNAIINTKDKSTKTIYKEILKYM